jgi:hypothetical protein
MDRQRIQLYTDAATKRRIRLASQRQELSMTEYCMEAIRRQLAEDGLLERTLHTDSLLDDIRELREQILVSRDGRPLEVDVLQMVRDERDEEFAVSH